MTLTANLIPDELPVNLDDRTANLGGAFYYSPIRPYSQEPLTWTWQALKRYPHATLIDVGASTGCYSLLAAHHPGLQVFSFEPVPLTCKVLRSNVALNNLVGRVKVYGKAVSNYEGMGVLHTVIADGGKGVSIVDGEPAYHKQCEQSRVNVTTIDGFCRRHKVIPTLCKIDCEGQEQRVLEGGAETIQRYKPFLLFEYSQENANQFGLTASDTIKLIESWGYVWNNPDGNDIYATPIGWESIMERCM